MSMTQRERMLLKGIEDELTRQDPLLCARLAAIDTERSQPLRVVPALVTLTVGITLMVFGAAAGEAPVAWTGLAVSVLASSWLCLVAVHRLCRRPPE